MSNELSIPPELKDVSKTFATQLEADEKLDVTGGPPRLKVINAKSAQDLRKEFGVGSAVIMPDGAVVAKIGERFAAVPIFKWLSYQKLRHKDDASDFFIVEETSDPGSPIARRAMNPHGRTEPYEDGSDMFYTFAEVVNFIFAIEGTGHVCAYGFLKGGHKYGANLSRYLDRRKADGLPVFCNRIDLYVEEAKNKKGDTWEQLMYEESKTPFVLDKGEQQRYAELFDGFHAQLHAGELKETESK